MQLKSLHHLLETAKKKPARKIVVPCAGFFEVLKALKLAFDEKLIIPILIGDKKEIEKLSPTLGFDISAFEVYHEIDELKAAELAVKLIREHQADILMKGMISTGSFLKPVIQTHTGLINNKLISHFALFESPYYHKLLGIADVAINISPDFTEKLEILKNSVEIYHKLGIPNPKVAVIAAVETVNQKMEATVHAAMFNMMNKRAQITGCIVEGPLAIDNAVSKNAAGSKGITGEVAGDADILIVPDLNSGNILYKSLNFLGGASSASVVAGASAPIVLASRADSAASKLMSIALASAIS